MGDNMGKTDKFLRTIIGISIAGFGIFFGSWWGFLAIVPLGTALIGYCPLYGSFDWSTTGKKIIKEPQ